MRFIVHIGVNKTGTSSLQRAFSLRRDALAKKGIVYPETGCVTSGHHNLTRVLSGAAPEKLGMPEDWEDRFHAECAGHDLCILSSENFANLNDPEALSQLCSPGRTKIVVYLRDYARYLVSWYQQALHSRNISPSLDEFLTSHKVSFVEIIDRWRAVYGEENVIIRHYDRSLLKNGDIVADFCDLVEPGLEEIFAGMEHDSNPSLSGNLLFFKRILNLFISREESQKIASEIIALSSLDPSFCGKLEVKRNVIVKIQALTKEDADRVEEKTGLDLRPRTQGIQGSPSPDLSRLGADLEKILVFAQGRDFQTFHLVQRLAPLGLLQLFTGSGSQSSPETQGMVSSANISGDKGVRELARSLFAVQSTTSEDPSEAWVIGRQDYVSQARKIMRRLDAVGYHLAEKK